VNVHGNPSLFKSIADSTRSVLAVLKVFLNLVSVLKKVRNRTVSVRQRERCVLSNDLFRGVATEITPNHELKQHAGVSHAYGTVLVDP
jgi:hypothetical protein